MRRIEFLALLLSLFDFTILVGSGDVEMIIFSLIFIIICLHLIFFAEILGNYTGPSPWSSGGGGYIQSKSHPALVRFLGFIFLLVPLVVMVLTTLDTYF